MANSIKDKLFAVIDDSRALVHVFIVIFYFEDFMICSQNTSLLRMAISFESIPLLPFIIFFALVAVIRAFWFLFQYTLFALRDTLQKTQGDQSIRDSFTAFLLCVFSGFYIWQFIFNESIRPVKWGDYPNASLFFLLFLLVTFGFSLYLGIWRGTDFSDGNEKK